VSGGAVGFPVGGGQGFLAVTVACSLSDNVDMRVYAWLAGIQFAMPGSIIGAVIGEGIGRREEVGSPDSFCISPREENLCPNCRCRVADGPKTCK
jgi:hypothetical protein